MNFNHYEDIFKKFTSLVSLKVCRNVQTQSFGIHKESKKIIEFPREIRVSVGSAKWKEFQIRLAFLLPMDARCINACLYECMRDGLYSFLCEITQLRKGTNDYTFFKTFFGIGNIERKSDAIAVTLMGETKSKYSRRIQYMA